MYVAAKTRESVCNHGIMFRGTGVLILIFEVKVKSKDALHFLDH